MSVLEFKAKPTRAGRFFDHMGSTFAGAAGWEISRLIVPDSSPSWGAVGLLFVLIVGCAVAANFVPTPEGQR